MNSPDTRRPRPHTSSHLYDGHPSAPDLTVPMLRVPPPASQSTQEPTCDRYRAWASCCHRDAEVAAMCTALRRIAEPPEAGTRLRVRVPHSQHPVRQTCALIIDGRHHAAARRVRYDIRRAVEQLHTRRLVGEFVTQSIRLDSPTPDATWIHEYTAEDLRPRWEQHTVHTLSVPTKFTLTSD